MSEKLLLILIGSSLGLGLVGGILKDIVWDWLKNRRGSGMDLTPIRCDKHEDCQARLKDCEQCLSKAKKDHASLAATFTAHAQHVDRRLDEGRQDFRALREDISGIRESLSSIAAIIKERTRPINHKGG